MPRAAPRIPRAPIQHVRKRNDRLRPQHRRWIGTLQCVACGRRPCCAAHVRIGTDGGTSLKPSDRYTVPLCLSATGFEGCHDRQHRGGEQTFWAELGIDPLDLACRLWTVSGNDTEGERAVFRARQSIALKQSIGTVSVEELV